MSVCPSLDQHTPHPTGYLSHSAWAEQMMLTHTQRKCPSCGLFEVWELVDASGLYARAIADNECSRCDTYYAEGALIRTDGNCGWIAFDCCGDPRALRAGESR